MAQKREKDETLELKAPLSLSSCPDNCKISGNPQPPTTATTTASPSAGDGSRSPGPVRTDPEGSGAAEPRSRSEIREDQSAATVGIESRTEPVKKPVNRCSGCGKRVGLTGFRCRCGDLFCSEHRYSDRHDCSFDYKAAGREAIARENPVVRAAKILKV